jgi:hypothetical protein
LVVLLEGEHWGPIKIGEASGGGDQRPKEPFLRKALAILEELHRRLNHEQGGDLVDNLDRLYGWWRKEILEAGEKGEASDWTVAAGRWVGSAALRSTCSSRVKVGPRARGGKAQAATQEQGSPPAEG